MPIMMINFASSWLEQARFLSSHRPWTIYTTPATFSPAAPNKPKTAPSHQLTFAHYSHFDMYTNRVAFECTLNNSTNMPAPAFWLTIDGIDGGESREEFWKDMQWFI